MKKKIYTTCNKCKSYGLKFRSNQNIKPIDAIAGNADADIWIIRLNPKNKIGQIEERSLEDINSLDPNSHPYFRDFNKVSEKLYKNWEKEDSNIAHVDIVKCFLDFFPPKSSSDLITPQRQITNNCGEYLKDQLLTHKPKIIICNGTQVSWEMMRYFPPKDHLDFDTLTSYQSRIFDYKPWIVLSGFISRVDNRNRRRLGMEIEQIIEKENVKID